METPVTLGHLFISSRMAWKRSLHAAAAMAALAVGCRACGQSQLTTRAHVPGGACTVRADGSAILCGGRLVASLDCQVRSHEGCTNLVLRYADGDVARLFKARGDPKFDKAARVSVAPDGTRIWFLESEGLFQTQRWREYGVFTGVLKELRSEEVAMAAGGERGGAVPLAKRLSSGASARPSYQLPQSADISVSGIDLEEPKSVRRVLGDAPSPSEDVTGPDAGFPTLKVCNATRTELLVLGLHPGSVVDSYGEFHVRSLSKPSTGCLMLAGVDHFVSGKGIRLGMSRTRLVGILGPGFSERKEGTDSIVHYTIDDLPRSSFLQHYNLPVYFGSYRFRKGKLVSFAFGFEYP